MSAPTTARTELFARVLAPENRANPYPLYAELRAQPVSQQADGTWVVSGFDEISALLHDPRISSDMDNADHATRMDVQKSLLTQDPPNHDRLRRAVMTTFTPAVVESLRADVRRMTDRLLDAVGSRTRVDVVDEIAYPLPVAVICALLGIPERDEARFHGWADTIARGLDLAPTMSQSERDAIAHASTELTAYLAELTAQRAQRPGSDLISGLISGGARSEALTGEDLVITTRLLLIAGHETTANQIANFAYLLLSTPGQWEALRADPDLVPDAVEELLRYVQLGSGGAFARVATEDVEVGGTTVRAGEAVFVNTQSANRDESVFHDPAELDLTRQHNPHIAFGHGVHHCLVAQLARVELQVALGSLLNRFPRLRLAVPAEEIPWKTGLLVRGPVALPVIW